MLHAATDLDSHVTQLDAALAGRLPNRNAAFVRRFIRPHGLDRPATPVFVEALEVQAAAPPCAPIGQSLGERAWERVARAWYAAADRPSVQWLMLETSHVVEERDRARRVESKQRRLLLRDEQRRARAMAKEERYRAKRRRQLVAQLKTAVRRVLTTAAGGGAGSRS